MVVVVVVHLGASGNIAEDANTHWTREGERTRAGRATCEETRRAGRVTTTHRRATIILTTTDLCRSRNVIFAGRTLQESIHGIENPVVRSYRG